MTRQLIPETQPIPATKSSIPAVSFLFIAALTLLSPLAVLGYQSEIVQPSAKSSSASAAAQVNVPTHAELGTLPQEAIRTQPAPKAGSQAKVSASAAPDGANPLFLPVVTYDSGGGGAGSVAIADVNGDGKLDVVLTNAVGEANGDGAVSVLLGNGDGTFQPAVRYDSGGVDPGWVAIADVNGDGIPDLIVANECVPVNCGASSVGVLLGSGDGSFQPVVTYPAGQGAASGVAVADLNGDGEPDIVVTNCGGDPCLDYDGQGAVNVLLANGGGTFQTPVAYSLGVAVAGVTIADVNQDGILDLVVGFGNGSFAGGIATLLGKGDGTFYSPSFYEVGTPASNPVVADVNGDGIPDVLAASGHTLSVLLGRGQGRFGPPSSYFVSGLSPISLAVADLNGDGNPDLAAATVDGGIGVLFGHGDGTFQTAVIYSTGGNGGAEWFLVPSAVAVADLNNNGKLDLVAVTGGAAFGSDGSADVLLNNRQGPPYTATATTLFSSVNPAMLKQSITYTATVTSQSGGAVTGTVTFLDASAFAGTPVAIQPLTGNQASCTVSYSEAGTHAITASYSGDAANSFSNSSTLLEYAGTLPLGTVTRLRTSKSPSFFGQPVTFTATVTWLDGTVPNGETVTFSDSGITIGAGTTAGGVATFTTSSLPAGTQVVEASYPGDPTFKASQGVFKQVVTLPVPTQMSLVTSGSPSLFGQPVTFTATLTAAYGTIPNGEIVTFYDDDGATVIGTGATSSGTAAFTTSSLTARRHTIKATYAGDATFGKSSAVVDQAVDLNATATALVSSLNPSIYGQPITWTATVSSSAPVAPTGTVTFKWGDYNLGERSLNASGVASLVRSNLNADSYALIAIYGGDAYDASSTSAILNQVVTQATSTATMGSSPNPSTQGQAVTFTATISSPTATPTGPVTFTAGKTVLGTAELGSGGKATFTTSTLPVGSNTVQVTYPWNSDIAASSASITQVVQPQPSTQQLAVDSPDAMSDNRYYVK